MGNLVLLTWTNQRSLPNAIFVFGIFFRFVLIKILCYILEENIWRNKELVSTGDSILYHVAGWMNTSLIKRKVRNNNLYFRFIQDWSCIIINTTHFFLIPSFWLLSSFLLSLVKLNPLPFLPFSLQGYNLFFFLFHLCYLFSVNILPLREVLLAYKIGKDELTYSRESKYKIVKPLAGSVLWSVILLYFHLLLLRY